LATFKKAISRLTKFQDFFLKMGFSYENAMYFRFLAYHICATINIHPAGGGADYGENGVFHENPRFCVCFAMLYTYLLFGATSCPQSCHSSSHVQVDGLPRLCVCVLVC
jgi:hypothetical protein